MHPVVPDEFQRRAELAAQNPQIAFEEPIVLSQIGDEFVGKRIAPGFASDRRLDPAFDADACLADRRIEITLSEQRGNPIAETLEIVFQIGEQRRRPGKARARHAQAFACDSGCKRRRIIPVPVGGKLDLFQGSVRELDEIWTRRHARQKTIIPFAFRQDAFNSPHVSFVVQLDQVLVPDRHVEPLSA